MKKLSMIAFAATVVFASEANAYDRRVVISNDSSYRIVALYASNVGEDSWQEDMLDGRRAIRPGERRIADFDDESGYCRYDLKAVMSSGEVIYRYRVNVCAASVWEIASN